jgi:hypothetical protein
MNRRELLRSSTVAGAGLLLSRSTDAAATHGGTAQTSSSDGPTVLSKARALGRGDASLSVSALSLGCMGMHGGRGRTPDEARMEKLIQHAYDRGCTFFDTAEGYGNGRNEELVGRAIAPFPTKVVLGTKRGHHQACASGLTCAAGDQRGRFSNTPLPQAAPAP